MKLGIDIGRVLITPDDADQRDTSFIGGSIEDALATPPYDGMFDAVTALTARFGGAVWLVSKCGPSVQRKTTLWLARHRFFKRTGIPPGHLRFCLQRPEKALHCRQLGITHFVDDRSDVMRHLDGVVGRRYLFGPQRRGTEIPAGVVACPSWPAAQAAIERDLAAG